MPWIPGTNFRVDPFVTAGGNRVSAISGGSPSPIKHVIEIQNGTTVPYTVRVQGEVTGLCLSYNGQTTWQTQSIAVPPRATVQPDRDLTYGTSGIEYVSCSSAELDDLRTGSKSTHNNLGFVSAIRVT
jgi:hypothetical protein